MSGRAAAAALCLCAGCGLLLPPDAALVDETARLEALPPSLPLSSGTKPGALRLTRLRFERPRVAPSDGGAFRVDAVIWAEGRIEEAGLVFHGPEVLPLVRPGFFGAWRLEPAFPNLRSLAALLAARSPPDKVAAWQVGLVEQNEAEVREQYVKDASDRPVRAANSFTVRRPSTALPWSVVSR